MYARRGRYRRTVLGRCCGAGGIARCRDGALLCFLYVYRPICRSAARSEIPPIRRPSHSDHAVGVLTVGIKEPASAHFPDLDRHIVPTAGKPTAVGRPGNSFDGLTMTIVVKHALTHPALRDM